MGMTVREAAKLHGYGRYTATYDDDNGGDVDRDNVVLVEKTNEIEGNRVWYRAEDGRYVEIAQLFRMA